MDVSEIYTLLLEGKTAVLQFVSRKEAEYCRVRLAKYKKHQDWLLVTAGIQTEEEISSLFFSYNNETGFAEVKFGEKKKARGFTVFKVVEAPDENVSDNLGGIEEEKEMHNRSPSSIRSEDQEGGDKGKG